MTVPTPGLLQLVSLLADGRFHSGTELAQTLAVSRSTVWKQMQGLTEWGLEWSALTGKGYKLLSPLQLLEEATLRAHLTPETAELLGDLELHAVIDSTNTYLKQRRLAPNSQASVCFAEYQTAGKGRRGRPWVSPFGHNLYLSIAWEYADGPAALAGLSLIVGLAVVRALSRAGIDGIGLKWPNDIYWQQRKLAGILIEVSGESDGPCQAVIGLGLNFYLPRSEALAIDQAWVDLRQILGEHVYLQRNRIAASILNEVLPAIAHYQTDRLTEALPAWRSYDCLQGKPVVVSIGAQRIEGIAQGIDHQGLLLLTGSDGQLRSFASGEVSVKAL